MQSLEYVPAIQPYIGHEANSLNGKEGQATPASMVNINILQQLVDSSGGYAFGSLQIGNNLDAYTDQAIPQAMELHRSSCSIYYHWRCREDQIHSTAR